MKIRSALSAAFHIAARGLHPGYCPICARKTVFILRGKWRRDEFRCARCNSIPRFRALIRVLENFSPQWRQLAVHESSPGGSSSDKLRAECARYIGSHWYPDVPRGQRKDGYQSEDLEAQTFASESFDLVITQDVFEHVIDPAKGFREIERTLKAGGAHVFTVPWYFWKETRVRVVREGTEIRQLCPPEYHGNPIDGNGSLVTTDWGADLCDFIYKHSGMTTTVIKIYDPREGIDAEFIEVFISRKPHAAKAAADQGCVGAPKLL